jgi:hypothetical protein
MKRILPLSIILSLLLLIPHASHAITLKFQATDLADSGSGDLWQYLYVITDFTPQANVAVEVLFDPALYTDLEGPPPAVPGWDIIALQPDLNLPDAGRYSALALVDGASLAGPFSINFVWLGGAGNTPGVQDFEVNQFDVPGSFLRTITTGQTQPVGVVPEPGTLWLAGIGLTGLALVRKSRTR